MIRMSSSPSSVSATSSSSSSLTPLKNDLLLRAAKGEPVKQTPVWLFRQAGRHLPEYNEYKKLRNKNFLELLRDPMDVAECTMQPVRRYDVDAAILFSDILVVAEAMGMSVEMPGGKGITVPHPLTKPEDLDTKIHLEIDVKERLGHVMKAIDEIKKQLNGKVPLIGFSAAPWTLMFYMVGGSSKKNQQNGEMWLEQHPEASQRLLDALTAIVIDYLCLQVDHGADILQLFEAMGDYISEKNFYRYALPCMKRIRQELKHRKPEIAMMVFPRGATYSLADLDKAGYDVLTLDCATDRVAMRETLRRNDMNRRNRPDNGSITLQGNFDPSLLVDGNKEVIRESVKKMLEEFGGAQNLIANLGEGLIGKEKPELVNEFICAVHEISETMIREKKKGKK